MRRLFFVAGNLPPVVPDHPLTAERAVGKLAACMLRSSALTFPGERLP